MSDFVVIRSSFGPMSSHTHKKLLDANPRSSFAGGFFLLLKNLYQRRALIKTFVQRDLRLQYRGSTMGYFWSLLDPLLLSATFIALYVILRGSASAEYGVGVVVGVMTYTFFATSVNMGITSLADNGGMISAIYFPREVYATAAMLSQLLVTVLSLLVLIPAMVVIESEVTLSLLYIPCGLALLGMLALGFGLLLAPGNVRNRDIQHFFKHLTRAGMYLSPVLWSASTVLERPSLAPFLYNPIAPPIEMVRAGIYGTPIAVGTEHIISSVVVTVSVFILGAMVFRRYEAEAVMKI